jgi:phosphoribosyl-ATP pyrophosphohydrolase/phosphoribosyl-AMP cyclohydrolase
MQIDFDKMGGLAPAIVQEETTGDVLMVGFMNAEAYAKTAETGYVTFYSRTRQSLWTKGETSGNRLRVVSALTDCDRDTLLFRVFVEGDGLVCHTGSKSCFTEPLPVKGASPSKAKPGLPGTPEARQ